MRQGKNTAQLVPRLRFPKFLNAGGWSAPKLADISTPIEERVGDRALTPISISAGIGFVPQAERFGRDISGNQYRLYTVVRDGDFVYNKGNSLKFPQGCVYDLQGWGEVAAPNVFICFRLNDGYENRFFRQCFEQNIHGAQLRKHITSGARSNGLLNINRDTFFNIRIPTPNQDEQNCIANCLSSLDSIIAAKSQILNALKDLKKGLMQRLFPRVGEIEPNSRFLNDDEWSVANFPEVIFFQEGPGIMAVDFKTEGIPLVRLAGIGGIDVTLDGCNYLDPEKVSSKWAHFRLDANDLVISTSATFGLTSIVTQVAVGAVFYTGLIRFRPIDERLRTDYLKVFLSSPHFEKQAASAAVGGGIKHFGPTHLKKMKIPIPPLAEQQRIADCMNSLDVRIAAEAQEVQALKLHKQGLMQKLFPALDEVST